MELMSQTDLSLEIYMKEVKKIPLLSPEEEYRISNDFIKTRDPESLKKLVVSNLRFVVKVAYKFKRYGARLLDLIQEGNIGLLRAVHKFNPDRGYRLISYAVWWIRAHMQEYVVRNESLVQIGTTQANRKMFFKIKSVSVQVSHEIGSDEVSSEDRIKMMADHLGYSADEVYQLELRMASRDFSLDVQVGESQDSQLDLLPSHATSPEEVVTEMEVSRIQTKTLSKAFDVLTPREMTVIKARRLSESPPSLKELGAQLGVSRERIRQIEEIAIKKLRDHCVKAATV